MLTIVETWQFARLAERLFTDDERTRLIDYLSAHPDAGDEIVGSGGVRKLRFAAGGKGKSGGARVIYFFFNEHAPLYLITCYAKSAKEDLSRAEVSEYAKLTAAIKAHHRRN
jgi:hypothetical protein